MNLYLADLLPKMWVKHRRLFISFSGGKSSALMTMLLLKYCREAWDEIVVVFANTGEEHADTLAYVEKCDKLYGFKVVWVEAVFHEKKGVGTTFKLVNFQTAARKGEPFEAMLSKHGLPNTQFPHCTRELKRYPIQAYLRSLGWEKNSYNTAIGIRSDEQDRQKFTDMETGTFYPLITWGITKDFVLSWELSQSVRLGIPEHWGNCVWCWKKTNRKLATVARELPSAYDFPRRIEEQYRDAGPGFGDRRIFRGRKTTDDIFVIARDPSFEPFVDGFPFKDESLDVGMSCGETCEIGTDGFDGGNPEELI